MNIKEKLRAAERVLPVLERSMDRCRLCARRCGANRSRGEKGACGAAGEEPVVYSYSPHYGEEPPLSGDKGSGTIFFSHCGMKCVYCQNYRFSQEGAGREVAIGRLADMMMELADGGCHNINLVTPTHYAHMIVRALRIAWMRGLSVPVVYNTGGYDSMETIQLLEGLVDIYLPDMRYSSDEMARRYSGAPGYVSNNRLIVKEMYRQVGNLRLEKGVALKGLLIRLLVMPADISGTLDTLDFIAGSIGTGAALSVMSQYYPAYKAVREKELARRITPEEYRVVRERVDEHAFRNGWVQPQEGSFDGRFSGERFDLNV